MIGSWVSGGLLTASLSSLAANRFHNVVYVRLLAFSLFSVVFVGFFVCLFSPFVVCLLVGFLNLESSFVLSCMVGRGRL